MNDDATAKPDAPILSIAVLLTATLFVAIVLASWHAFGNRGIAPESALVAFAWFALSRINRQRITVVELLTIITICLILHVISIQAVQSRANQRRPVDPPATAPVTQPIGTSATSIDQPGNSD